MGDDLWVEMTRTNDGSGRSGTFKVFTDDTYTTLATDVDDGSTVFDTFTPSSGSGSSWTDDDFDVFKMTYHSGVGGTKTGGISVDDIQFCTDKTTCGNMVDEIGTVLSFETQQASTSSTTTTAPFLYFDMEDTGSTSTNQGSGSSLDGTNTNISTSQTGKIGSYSYQFGGNSKVEDIGTTSSFADLSSSDFSVGFWHKDSSLSQYESIVSSLRFSQPCICISILYLC